jgi:hypothetical protein
VVFKSRLVYYACRTIFAFGNYTFYRYGEDSKALECINFNEDKKEGVHIELHTLVRAIRTKVANENEEMNAEDLVGAHEYLEKIRLMNAPKIGRVE